MSHFYLWLSSVLDLLCHSVDSVHLWFKYFKGGIRTFPLSGLGLWALVIFSEIFMLYNLISSFLKPQRYFCVSLSLSLSLCLSLPPTFTSQPIWLSGEFPLLSSLSSSFCFSESTIYNSLLQCTLWRPDTYYDFISALLSSSQQSTGLCFVLGESLICFETSLHFPVLSQLASMSLPPLCTWWKSHIKKLVYESKFVLLMEMSEILNHHDSHNSTTSNWIEATLIF